jgi:hypothetical protein
MFLVVTCQHMSGTCQSHSRLVLSLRETLRKYVELSLSTPPFLTIQFHKKDLMPTPNLLQIRLILPPLGHILSKSPPKIVRPTSRRLNTKIPRVAAEYAWILENKILKHRLIERMGATYTNSRSRRKAEKCLNRLDDEFGDYTRHAEKKCQKIKSGRIPFLPEASLWICRTQVYRSLLKYHAGWIRNQGNLKRMVRRCNIPDGVVHAYKDQKEMR